MLPFKVSKIGNPLAQVSGSGSWGKVIDGNTRTYNPPALPRDLCPQVALIAEVHFGQKVISLRVVKGSLHADLKRHFQDPGAWWMGQIVSYLLRPRPDLKVFLPSIHSETNLDTT